MDISRVGELKDGERECLRTYLRYGSNKGVASALNMSLETVRARHRTARDKLGVTTTKEAAAALAAAEGIIPTWGASNWVMAPAGTLDHFGLVDAEQVGPVVRDSAVPTWTTDGMDRSPEGGRSLRDAGAAQQLRQILSLAVAIGTIVAIVLLVMKLLPQSTAWNTFQTDRQLLPEPKRR